MKLQLDTNNKTIKVEEQVGLAELVEILDKLLPNGEWKEYQLQTNTTIVWQNNPIVIHRDRWPNPIPLTYFGTERKYETPFEITCNNKLDKQPTPNFQIN
jgi:hypothetical protein